MSQQTRTVRSTLEVSIRFEPTRLAAEHVVDAYTQVAPVRIRQHTASRRAHRLHRTSTSSTQRSRRS
jgi:hypothetical protein